MSYLGNVVNNNKQIIFTYLEPTICVELTDVQLVFVVALATE